MRRDDISIINRNAHQEVPLYINTQPRRSVHQDEYQIKRGSRKHRIKGFSVGERKLTSIRRRFLSISLDLHSAGDSGVGLATGQVSHVDEGIVECGEDVAHTESVLGLFSGSSGGRSVVSDLFFFSTFFTFGVCCLLLLCLGLLHNHKR